MYVYMYMLLLCRPVNRLFLNVYIHVNTCTVILHLPFTRTFSACVNVYVAGTYSCNKCGDYRNVLVYV